MNMGRVIAYIYKDTVVNEEVDYVTDTATVDRDSERVVTWCLKEAKLL